MPVLQQVTGIADQARACDHNFGILERDVYTFSPSFVTGIPTTIIGPPTTGAHVLNEKWTDALGATWRCTIAGTPGTWRQETPAVTSGEPSTGSIPTNYMIRDADDKHRLKRHRGSYAWSDERPTIDLVFDFAGDLTGTTNISSILESAIDSLPSTGGDIFFPHGSYQFNIVVNKKNVHFVGQSCFKSMAGPDNAAMFFPADTADPCIQIGDNTSLINGFRMTDCSLSGGNGSGTFGTCGIYFMSAWQCFLRNVAIRGFDVNFKFQNGSAKPCAMIYVDGFVSQSNANASSVAIQIKWTDTSEGVFTTNIFFMNGHIDQPEGANSWMIEIDGVAVYFVNVECDCGVAGNGIKFARTNPAAHAPFMHCTNVILDHDSNSPVAQAHLSIASWGNYFDGNITINGQLRLSDASILNQPDGHFIGSAKSHYLVPALIGRIAIMALGTDLNYTDSKRIEAVGTLLTFANDGGDITLDPSGSVNISACPLVMDNNRGICLKSNTGVVEATMLMSSGNNLQLLSPTEGGDIQIIGRNAANTITLLPAGTATAAIYDGNTTAGQTRSRLWDTDAAALKRVKISTVAGLPGGAKVLYMDA